MSREEVVRRFSISIAAGLLAAALAVTVGCISEKVASRISPDNYRVTENSAPVVMPEIVVTAEPTDDASRIAMMPEVKVTAERLPEAGMARVGAGAAPDDAGSVSAGRFGYGHGRYQN
jgi:hypothetical protein